MLAVSWEDMFVGLEHELGKLGQAHAGGGHVVNGAQEHASHPARGLLGSLDIRQLALGVDVVGDPGDGLVEGAGEDLGGVVWLEYGGVVVSFVEGAAEVGMAETIEGTAHLRSETGEPLRIVQGPAMAEGTLEDSLVLEGGEEGDEVAEGLVKGGAFGLNADIEEGAERREDGMAQLVGDDVVGEAGPHGIALEGGVEVAKAEGVVCGVVVGVGLFEGVWAQDEGAFAGPDNLVAELLLDEAECVVADGE